MLKADVPFIRIIEQPVSRGSRFRYDSEGRYSGSILGVNSTSIKRSFPAIEIVNHKGSALVVVSCVSKDPPYYPHPHNLVGKMKEIVGGVCYFKTHPNESVITFPYLGIQCVRKKDIANSLLLRERHKVDPFNTGFSHRLQPDNIDLNSVRLCFQAFLEDQKTGKLNIRLDPIISQPIYDKKRSAKLVIHYLSHYSATVDGGKVIIILCDKATDDIKVRFFQDEKEWEAIAETEPPHYHKQVAIIFKSPKYFSQDISEPESVQLQLIRFSDGETSDPLPFSFLPVQADDHNALRRKRIKFSETPRNLVFRHLQADAAQRELQINEMDMYKPLEPNYSNSPSLIYPEMDNNFDMFNRNCTSFSNVTKQNHSQYYFQQPTNDVQDVNYSTLYQQ